MTDSPVVVTPTKKEAEKRTKVLTELQVLLNNVEENIKVPVEVYQKPNENQAVEAIGPSNPSSQGGYFGGCPHKAHLHVQGQTKFKYKDLPEVLVCYKEPFDPADQDTGNQQGQNNFGQQVHQHFHRKRSSSKSRGKKLRPCKSRELRAGNLFVGCDCEKRNGLQDSCPRTDCLGQPECLTYPNPTCPPSQFCNGKHLEKKKAAYLARMEALKTMRAQKCDPGCPLNPAEKAQPIQEPCEPGCPGPKNSDQQNFGEKHHDYKSSHGKRKVKYTCYPAKVRPPVMPVCFQTCIYADPTADPNQSTSIPDPSLINYEKALDMCKCVVNTN